MCLGKLQNGSKTEICIALDYKILNILMDATFKIRNIFAKEIEIEFVINENIIYIFQARPITTLKMGICLFWIIAILWKAISG